MYHSSLATESFSSDDHAEAQIHHVMCLELVVPRLPARAKCQSMLSAWPSQTSEPTVFQWTVNQSSLWAIRDLGMCYRLETRVHRTVPSALFISELQIEYVIIPFLQIR